MSTISTKDRRVFEIMLIIVAVGMAFLAYRLGPYKLIVFNLFFLPIVLSGYFLGRGSAGVLALFSALAVTIAVTLDANPMAGYSSPLLTGLALTVWAATLGLTAIMVGTLCDERAATLRELHLAYVGVVEVVSKYLQGANPHVKARSIRIAELSQLTAEELRLPPKEIDDIRVGTLLADLGNVEITTQIINKAVDTLESDERTNRTHTFLGTELAQSLGSVLSSAGPLIANIDDAVRDCLANNDNRHGQVPIGARVIRAVRAYDALTAGDNGQPPCSSPQAIAELRTGRPGEFDGDIIGALQRAVARAAQAPQLEPVTV